LKICLICNAFRTTVIRVCIWLDYSEAWLSAITILEFSTMELFLLVGSIEYFFWMLLRWMVLLLCARFITISLSWSFGCDLGFWVTVVIHLTKKTRSRSGYLTFWKVSDKRPLFEQWEVHASPGTWIVHGVGTSSLWGGARDRFVTGITFAL
jgi:hypothetical protein